MGLGSRTRCTFAPVGRARRRYPIAAPPQALPTEVLQVSLHITSCTRCRMMMAHTDVRAACKSQPAGIRVRKHGQLCRLPVWISSPSQRPDAARILACVVPRRQHLGGVWARWLLPRVPVLCHGNSGKPAAVPTCCIPSIQPVARTLSPSRHSLGHEAEAQTEAKGGHR